MIFFYMLERCKFILSDSGGIQEECTIINKFVLLEKQNRKPEIKINRLLLDQIIKI